MVGIETRHDRWQPAQLANGEASVVVEVEPLVESGPLVRDRQDDPRLFSGVGQVEIGRELGLRHPAVAIVVGCGVKALDESVGAGLIVVDDPVFVRVRDPELVLKQCGTVDYRFVGDELDLGPGDLDDECIITPGWPGRPLASRSRARPGGRLLNAASTRARLSEPDIQLLVCRWILEIARQFVAAEESIAVGVCGPEVGRIGLKRLGTDLTGRAFAELIEEACGRRGRSAMCLPPGSRAFPPSRR